MGTRAGIYHVRQSIAVKTSIWHDGYPDRVLPMIRELGSSRLRALIIEAAAKGGFETPFVVDDGPAPTNYVPLGADYSYVVRDNTGQIEVWEGAAHPLAGQKIGKFAIGRVAPGVGERKGASLEGFGRFALSAFSRGGRR